MAILWLKRSLCGNQHNKFLYVNQQCIGSHERCRAIRLCRIKHIGRAYVTYVSRAFFIRIHERDCDELRANEYISGNIIN